MRERRHLLDLSDVRTMQELQLMSARSDLAQAISIETGRCKDEDAAQCEIADVLSYWTACLENRALDAQLLDGLAATLRNRDAKLLAAQNEHEDARTHTDACRMNCAISDAQVERTQSVLRTVRRELVRASDERTLRDAEHRVACEWRGK